MISTEPTSGENMVYEEESEANTFQRKTPSEESRGWEVCVLRGGRAQQRITFRLTVKLQ